MSEEDSFFAGFLSGTVQTVVGHPLDTLKIWKQRNIQPNPTKLFRGICYPLLTGTFITGGQFASYEWFNKYTDSEFACGAFSGIFSGLFISPVDKYKIAAQTKGKLSNYGLLSCMMREIPAGAVYFGSYSYLRENNIPVLPAGGLSGASSWLLTYPLDIIKTQVQTGEFTTKDAVLNMIRGKTQMTNGLGFCLIRALIVNAIGFYVYECSCELRKNTYTNEDLK
jgi:solute carrier family 25 carnitine/acylcarnitine transporter 20/29